MTGNPVSFVDPFGLEKYCGQCAPGAYDCLLYNYNLCEPDTTRIDMINYKNALDILAEQRELMIEVQEIIGWKTGLDKYFHCKAHCFAERRGIGSYALVFSDIREDIQGLWDSPEACEKDRQANRKGVEGIKLYSILSCESICAIQVGRPDIPPQY